MSNLKELFCALQQKYLKEILPSTLRKQDFIFIMLYMDKIDRIRAWLAADRMTIKSLANELKMSPQHLGGVLNRRYALTRSTEARINEVMNASSKRISASVPPEVESCIRAWAEEAHTTIDRMAEMLLAELLNVPLSPLHHGEASSEKSQEK